MYRNREYYMALMYQYFVWARIPRTTPEECEAVASVANALHNMPSIVSVDEWTKKLSEDTWNSLFNATKINGGHEWLLYADALIRDDFDNDRDILPSWNWHNK